PPAASRRDAAARVRSGPRRRSPRRGSRRLAGDGAVPARRRTCSRTSPALTTNVQASPGSVARTAPRRLFGARRLPCGHAEVLQHEDRPAAFRQEAGADAAVALTRIGRTAVGARHDQVDVGLLGQRPDRWLTPGRHDASHADAERRGGQPTLQLTEVPVAFYPVA